MSEVRVQTPLAQERGTINLLAVGHPILVVVGANEMGSGSSSSSGLVTATANRLLTGKSLPGNVRVSVAESGDHVVTFDPDASEKGDFALAVLYKEQHVPGSPFFLCYVEPSALSSVRTERRLAVTDASKRINFIVPLEAKEGEMNVTVDGPFGECKAHVKNFSLEGAKESVSLCFEPKGLGAYTIHLTVDQEEVPGSPFLILADFSSEEARKCQVLPEDEHLFSKRLRFKGSGEGISLRVFTQTAVEISHGPGGLSVLCSGPKKASLRLTQAPDEIGIETCEVVPSAPGDYALALLWKGQHICDSPRTLRFRWPRSGKIVANGLDLHSQVYYLGVPYRFKLNCSDFGGGAPEISCEPSSVCDIRITPVEGTDSTYKCELLPSVSGAHSLSVKFRGKEISGSPFKVTFRDSCNPAACKIVQGSKSYTAGGVLGLKVSTEGAGTGTLEAVAEDSDTRASLPLSMKELSADLYQLEFNPGECTGCQLSVTYSKHHIPGSPFKMVFSNPNQFVLKGEGLMGGRVGVWNRFTLQLKDPVLGALGVKVETNDKDKFCAATSITSIAKHKFEVKYLPTVPGQYTIKAKWGQFPIPGSPFRVKCTSAAFQLRGVPKRVEFGSRLNFEVFLVSGGPLDKNDTVEVSARTAKGKKARGTATLVEWENEKVYTCSLTPRVTGSHMVSIKWNSMNISGSPFGVKVVAMARPENVRVYGPGVELGEVGGDREFTIETGSAGGGILAVKIRGPTKVLKFSTRQDSRNKRTLHTKYSPTLPGRYCIEVQWAGRHVPGSPFNISLLPPSQGGGDKLTITAEVHPEFMAADTRMEGLGAAAAGDMSLSQDSLNVESHFERGVHMSLSQDSTNASLGTNTSLGSSFRIGADSSMSQDSRNLDSPYGEVAGPGGGGKSPNHISIYVEDRDSVCSNGPLKDAEVQLFKRPPLSPQDSLESNTSSLYDMPELNRRVSNDQIAIRLSGDVSLT